MILQRDSRLNADIQARGCYYMSLLFLANKWARHQFDIAEIRRVYEHVVTLGWMREDCYILTPERILGYVELETVYLGHRGPHYLCGERDIEVLCYQRGGQTHFVTGDGKGHVAYDPWGVSRAVAEGTLVSKRIFRRL